MTRKIVKTAAEGGKCGLLLKSAKCNDKKCPNDCMLGPWTEFGKCTADFQHRSRKVVYKPKDGGKACGSLKEKAKCGASKQSTGKTAQSMAATAQAKAAGAKAKAVGAKAKAAANELTALVKKCKASPSPECSKKLKAAKTKVKATAKAANKAAKVAAAAQEKAKAAVAAEAKAATGASVAVQKTQSEIQKCSENSKEKAALEEAKAELAAANKEGLSTKKKCKTKSNDCAKLLKDAKLRQDKGGIKLSKRPRCECSCRQRGRA